MSSETNIFEDKHEHEGKKIVLRYQLERRFLNATEGLTCNRGNCGNIGARHDKMTLLSISVDGRVTDVRNAVSVLFLLPPRIQNEIKSGNPLQIISCTRHLANDLLKGL